MIRRKVFAISGSTRKNSSNLQICTAIGRLYEKEIELDIYPSVALLPHFNPDNDNDEDLPDAVKLFRKKIQQTDGVLICSPEYVFSIPGSLKNAIEWTVGSVVFSEKPLAIITASGLGEKAHESLQLIMKTIYANVTADTQLLIKGARSKIGDNGFTDIQTLQEVKNCMNNLLKLMK